MKCAGIGSEGGIRVPTRLGFVHEATLRKERWVAGSGRVDTLRLGMLREDWRDEPKGLRIG